MNPYSIYSISICGSLIGLWVIGGFLYDWYVWGPRMEKDDMMIDREVELTATGDIVRSETEIVTAIDLNAVPADIVSMLNPDPNTTEGQAREEIIRLRIALAETEYDHVFHGPKIEIASMNHGPSEIAARRWPTPVRPYTTQQ